MKEFKSILDLTCNLHLIPEVIAIDTLKRVTDWLSTENTTVEDSYIKRQLDYASKFIDKDLKDKYVFVIQNQNGEIEDVCNNLQVAKDAILNKFDKGANLKVNETPIGYEVIVDGDNIFFIDYMEIKG